MEPIDIIFQKSETQKKVAISVSAWNRLDEQLESDQKRLKWKRLWLMSVAASMIILAGFFFANYSNFERDYHIEQLIIAQEDIVYSSADIAFLNQEYRNKKLRTYNKEAQVKVSTIGKDVNGD